MSVWDELVGQAQVVATFQAAATGARPQVPTAAMSHAWLVTGPPGSGRSTAALALLPPLNVPALSLAAVSVKAVAKPWPAPTLMWCV